MTHDQERVFQASTPGEDSNGQVPDAKRMNYESHVRHGDPLLDAAMAYYAKKDFRRKHNLKKKVAAVLSSSHGHVSDEHKGPVEHDHFNDPLLEAAMKYDQEAETKHLEHLRHEHSKLFQNNMHGTIVGDHGWFFNDMAPIPEK